MSKCPYCDHILPDVWLKKIGATLMGKTSGENKARSTESASGAANQRWERVRIEAFKRWEKQEKAKAARAKRKKKPPKKKQFPT